VSATRLDAGIDPGSIRTMYGLLARADAGRERRHQRRQVHDHKPELWATGPKQVWSWEITTLKGPVTWSDDDREVSLDIDRRAVVGWMVAPQESAALAQTLIQPTCSNQGIRPGQLTIHADRGSRMTATPVAWWLADLGVTKTHRRPQVSPEKPYAEAQFKTLKYRPDFPERLGSLEAARACCQPCFRWYHTAHQQAGLGMLTPEMVHDGRAPQVMAARAQTVQAAFDAPPERLKGQKPAPAPLPRAVWMNPPVAGTEEKSVASRQ
jgi:putative transposase